MSNFETDFSLPLTAFSDLRVAELTPLFRGSFEYTVDNTELLEQDPVGSGTAVQSQGMGVIATGTTTGSSMLLQTEAHARYQAGFGGLWRYTALFTPNTVGCEQLTGLADSKGSSAAFKNGYTIGFDKFGVYGFHRFQNDVKFTDPLSAWDDPLDGTGDSGMVLDKEKLNIFFVNFQYLGAGAIGIYMENDSTGKIFLVHVHLYVNRNTVPSTFNPNFHGVYYVSNGATTANVSISSASYAYFIEGKSKISEIHQPQQSSQIQQKTGVTTERAIFTIRCRALYHGKENFIDSILERISCSIEASSPNNLANIRLIKNTTLGGTPVWANIETNNSIIEIDTAGTTVTGGKTILNIPLAGKNDKWIEHLLDLDLIMRNTDSITVAATSTNSATVNAALLWKELF